MADNTFESLEKAKQKYYELKEKGVKDVKKYLENYDFSKNVETDEEAKNVNQLWTLKDLMEQGIIKDAKAQDVDNDRVKKFLENERIWDLITIDELGKKIVEEIPARQVVFLCCLGRLVENSHPSSFNLIVHSESSAGKDHIVKSVIKLIPEDDIFFRTRITKTVLNYKMPPKGTWDGMVIYIPDISEELLNSDAVKVMGSEGSHITVVEKTKDGMSTRDIEIPGKPSMITTSANAVPNDEVLNRFSVVKLNESQEQTQKIYNFMAEVAQEGTENSFSEVVLQAMKRLKRAGVRVPYAKKLASVFPYNKLSGRRGFNRFIDFIKASAVLHQRQRRWIDSKTVEADYRDYEIARECFKAINAGTCSIPLNKRQREVVDILKKADEPLQAGDIHKRMTLPIALKNLYPHIESLCNLKILSSYFQTSWNNREVTTYALSDEYYSYTDIELPHSHEL